MSSPDSPYEPLEPLCVCGHLLDEHDDAGECCADGCDCVYFDEADA